MSCNSFGTLQKTSVSSVTDPIPYRDYPYPAEPNREFFYTNPAAEAISFTVGFRQSKTAVFDWSFFRLDSGPSSYRQWSRFFSFCALPRGGWCEGVLLYCCMAVENRLSALCFARSARATRARVPRTLVPASWWLWVYIRKPPKLRSWSCTQPRAAKATAGVAVVGKDGIDTTSCCPHVINVAGERT